MSEESNKNVARNNGGKYVCPVFLIINPRNLMTEFSQLSCSEALLGFTFYRTPCIELFAYEGETVSMWNLQLYCFLAE